MGKAAHLREKVNSRETDDRDLLSAIRIGAYENLAFCKGDDSNSCCNAVLLLKVWGIVKSRNR